MDTTGADSSVQWGTSATALTEVNQGIAVKFVDSGELKATQYFHVANMTGLAASSVYYYRVGGDSGW
jgi:hypothetical protein